MGIGTLIKISIGIFLFGIFGAFVNDFFYYIGVSWDYVYNIVYFIFNILGISSFGTSTLVLLYYLPVLALSYIIIRKFVII